MQRWNVLRIGLAVLLWAYVPPTQAAVFLGLGDLPGKGYLSIARAISPDGRFVVGQSDSLLGQSDEAFRLVKPTASSGSVT